MEILNNFGMIYYFITFILGAMFMFTTFCIAAMCKTQEPKNTQEHKNKVHFYVARDKDGMLWLYLGKPIRQDSIFSVSYGTYGCCVINKCHFKYFGLNENDFTNLKWEDEPVEVFINLED